MTDSEIKGESQVSSQKKTCTPPCSGDDSFLKKIVEEGLKASPWLEWNDSHLTIHWEIFLRSFPHLLPQDAPPEAILLQRYHEVTGAIPLAWFRQKSFTQLLLDPQTGRGGYTVASKVSDIPRAIVLWFEQYRDLAQRVLFDWEEFQKIPTAEPKSPILRQTIVPDLYRALQTTHATKTKATRMVVYPLGFRLIAGGALPSELAQHISQQRSPITHLEHLLRHLAERIDALDKVFQYLSDKKADAFASNHSRSLSHIDFSHGVFRELREKNAIFIREFFDRSTFGDHKKNAPPEYPHFSQERPFYALLSAQNEEVFPLPEALDRCGEKILRRMFHTIRDFCFYFYSSSSQSEAIKQKYLDQAYWLERTIPHLTPSPTPSTIPFPQQEGIIHPSPAELEYILEELINRSPLVMLLSSGFLSTYTLQKQASYGVALRPYVIATALAKKSSGKPPYYYIKDASSKKI